MPTRLGWAAIAAAGFAFAIGRVFGLIELYVIGAGLVAALGLAMAVVRLPLPPLAVRRHAQPQMVAVGEPARVDIEVTNMSRRHSPYLHLWEGVGEQGGAPMQLAPLAPHACAGAAYHVPTTHRGRVQIGPLRATRSDALSLCSRSTVLTSHDEVLVIPRYITMPFPEVGSAGRLGQHLRLAAWGQTGTEFHSMREYVPGDDLRRISWKASARSNDLLVRETEVDGIRRCAVLLDAHAEEFDHLGFERAVSAAASLVTSAVAAGVGTRLVSSGTDLRGPDVATNALRWLALAERTAMPLDPAALLGGTGEGIGLVFVVTGSSTSPAVDVARTITGPDDVLVIVAAQSRPTTGRFCVDATSLERLAADWGALVHGSTAGSR